MTLPQPQPADQGPNVVAILLIALAAGVALIIGMLGALLLASPPPEEPEEFEWTPWTAPPKVCTDPCFTVEDALALAPGPSSLALIGSPSPLGEPHESGTASDWEADASEAFYLGSGTPAACKFAVTAAPIAPSSTSPWTPGDIIVDLGSRDGLTQVVRVMEDELIAGRYPTTIRAVLASCASYSIEADDGATRSVTVSPLDLELGVAGVEVVAWTEASDGTLVTAADLRYENLVVRTEVSRQADSPVTDDDVEAFIRDTAQRIAGL